MSRDEITVRTGMQRYDEERKDLVMALKSAVWNGTYDPDIDEVAEAVLSERDAECLIARLEEDEDRRAHPDAGV